MIQIYSRENFLAYEDLSFLVISVPVDFVLTLRDITNNLYIYKPINRDWQTSNTLNTTTISANSFTTTTLPSGTYSASLVRVPSRVIRKGVSLFVHVSDGTNTDYKYVQYGEFISPPELVNVYGVLYDALGNPIPNTPITFTVINPVSYFDNSLATKIVATATTNLQGAFSIHLNRRYNYIVSIPNFDYLKIIKLSNLPASANSYELIINSNEQVC